MARLTFLDIDVLGIVIPVLVGASVVVSTVRQTAFARVGIDLVAYPLGTMALAALASFALTRRRNLDRELTYRSRKMEIPIATSMGLLVIPTGLSITAFVMQLVFTPRTDPV